MVLWSSSRMIHLLHLLIPFLGGWTSINPSYFDVNYRGTIGFDTLPNWSSQWNKLPLRSHFPLRLGSSSSSGGTSTGAPVVCAHGCGWRWLELRCSGTSGPSYWPTAQRIWMNFAGLPLRKQRETYVGRRETNFVLSFAIGCFFLFALEIRYANFMKSTRPQFLLVKLPCVGHVASGFRRSMRKPMGTSWPHGIRA